MSDLFLAKFDENRLHSLKDAFISGEPEKC